MPGSSEYVEKHSFCLLLFRLLPAFVARDYHNRTLHIIVIIIFYIPSVHMIPRGFKKLLEKNTKIGTKNQSVQS